MKKTSVIESSENRQRSNAMSFTFCMIISFLVSLLPILGPIIFAFITGRIVVRRKMTSKWAYLGGIIIGEMLFIFSLFYLFLGLSLDKYFTSLLILSAVSVVLTALSFIVGVYCETRSKKLSLKNQ